MGTWLTPVMCSPNDNMTTDTDGRQVRKWNRRFWILYFRKREPSLAVPGCVLPHNTIFEHFAGTGMSLSNLLKATVSTPERESCNPYTISVVILLTSFHTESVTWKIIIPILILALYRTYSDRTDPKLCRHQTAREHFIYFAKNEKNSVSTINSRS